MERIIEVTEAATTVNSAFAAALPEGSVGTLTVLTRVVPVGEASQEKLNSLAAELAEEARQNGLTRFTAVQVSKRPMGNKKGGPLVYLLSVQGL